MIRLFVFLSIIFASPCWGWGTLPLQDSGGVATAAVETDFIFTMRTTSASETVTLPATGTNDFYVDWGDGSSEENVTSASPTHEYATADDYEIHIRGTCPVFQFRNGGDCLKMISVSNLGDLGYTTINEMFRGCSNMTSFDAGNGDVSGATTFRHFFNGCSSLTSVNFSVDTSSIVNMSSMFNSNTSLTSLTFPAAFTTESVTTFNGMFYNTSSLDVDVSDFDITSLTDAGNMFYSSDFSDTNYDLLLVAWEGQTELTGVSFHAGSAQYGSGAPATARGVLVNTSSWSITDGGSQ